MSRVTLVVDDQASPGLRAEHGFAAWVEWGGHQILFDTGQGDALGPNADALGIDLGHADAIVLSHGHYDHGGALPLAQARAPTAALHVHPKASAERFSIRDGAPKSVGLSGAARRALETHAVGVRSTRAPTLVTPDVGVTGPIPRETDFEDTGGPFFLDPDGVTPDPIEDDMALWVRTPRGLVVVLGCGHAGVVNTARYALEASGATTLRAVIGGFHLREATDARLAHTIDALGELGPTLVAPCHCTGAKAAEALAHGLGDRVTPGRAGMVFEL